MHSGGLELTKLTYSWYATGATGCACFMPYAMNGDSTAVVVMDTCMVCTYEYVDVRTKVRVSEMKLVVKN